MSIQKTSANQTPYFSVEWHIVFLILIVDTHNKFRSKAAESFFKKLASHKFGVKGAGLILDLMRPYVCQNVHAALNNLGYRVDNDQPRQLYRQDFEWADRIIIVGKGFPVNVFDRVKEKVIFWDVDDALEEEREKIEIKKFSEISYRIGASSAVFGNVKVYRHFEHLKNSGS